MLESDFAHADLTRSIIAGCRQTYHELGSGFSERVCQNALAIVLTDMGLTVCVELPLRVEFRGRILGRFLADMVVNKTILLEIKAGQALEGYAQAQLLNYLKAAGGGVGLLLNFGRHPEHKRMVVGNPKNSLPLLTRLNEPAAALRAAKSDNEQGGCKQRGHS